jgi:hypothetical protein
LSSVKPSDWIALAALAVTAVGLVMNALVLDRQRHAGERSQRQREAAMVLGPVYVLLTEVNPERWIFTAGPGAKGRVDDMARRWEQNVRNQLQTIKAGSASAQERRLAEELDIAVHNALVSSSAYGLALPAIGEPWTCERAQEDYLTAYRLADRLAAVIRGMTSLRRVN